MLYHRLALVTLFLTLLHLPVTAQTPRGTIEVKLRTIEGSEGGYGPPRVGSTLRINLKDISQLQTLEFGDKMQYVPLPGRLKVVDVDWKGKTWDSLRAVASDENRRSVVTLDLQKVGAGNQIRCWIVVESQNRVRGVLYSEGTHK